MLNDNIDNFSKNNEAIQDPTSNKRKMKDVFPKRRTIYIGVAVILVLLAVVISAVIVPNQKKEQILPIEDITVLEENDFSTVVLPIK